ncbi:zinc ribbon domain-containing protein [Flagellimonas sp. HMM57]|uniref:zinc-ribbon domain-containing protein n=1 Tax=unclassified Flagellimonas TaxID=2644544 RepID=UPI0013D54920|nr:MULTISPECIES: zinc-ribbon domain-containing protein [unclassified Flagellimonas]UII77275.1 zinc ribbon domain-containing protein [Flagellimonas sp. HMM57]
MIFFFGTRASKIKERKLKGTACPYCQTKDSFTVSTFSKYFHFFWIPIIPLFKTHVAECSHCKKTYSKAQFTPEMLRSLENENRIDPAKRPLWQGCGCLLLVVVFAVLFGLSMYGVYMRANNPNAAIEKVDARRQLLDVDIAKMTKEVQQKDTLAFALKSCVDYDIVDGLDTGKIEYFTKLKEDKLLILMKVSDIKKIDVQYRKELIDVIEDCLYAMDRDNLIKETYIGVEGKWNTVLVKTPFDEDLGGRFADKNLLLPFYGIRDTTLTTTKIKDTFMLE